MKAAVISCTRRRDDKFLVVIADTVGGRNQRQVLSDWEVKPNSDVIVRDGKIVR